MDVESRASVLQALVWFNAGIGLADALHLASASSAAELATLDKRFGAVAERCGASPPVRVL